MMKTGKIIVPVLAVFLIGILCAAYFIRIENVTVTGNEKYTQQELEERILDVNQFSRMSVYQMVLQFLGKKEDIPFVEDYKLVFESPKSVEIIVYEKSIVGYVTYMNNYMFFDKDGIIVDSSPDPLENIPEITGLKYGSIVLYRVLPVSNEDIFTDILNITQLIQNYGIDAYRLDYDERGMATLYLDDIEVVLGTNSGLRGKIAELRDILPNLRERMAGENVSEGILYLDSYDENDTNPTYTFRKK